MRHVPWLVPLLVLLSLTLVTIVRPASPSFNQTRRAIEGQEPAQKKSAAQPSPSASQQARGENAGIYARYCYYREKWKDRDDCVIQVRTALATEKQASYAEFGIWLVGFTIVLTAIAAAAAVVAARRAGDQATAAQKQARVAEDAYLGLERPYILETVKTGSRTSERANKWVPYAMVALRNYGKVPCVVEEVLLDLVFSDDVPAAATITKGQPTPGNEILANRDDVFKCDIVRSPDITNAQINAIEKLDKVLWLCGTITYDDPQGMRYAQPIVWMYDPKNGFLRCSTAFVERRARGVGADQRVQAQTS